MRKESPWRNRHKAPLHKNELPRLNDRARLRWEDSDSATSALVFTTQKTHRRELSFHCLRHAATSLMKNTGVSPAIVQDVGHDSKTVSQHYTHIEPAALSSLLKSARISVDGALRRAMPNGARQRHAGEWAFGDRFGRVSVSKGC